MQLTETLKLYPTVEQEKLLRDSMDKYIYAVNQTVKTAISGISIAKYSSKDISIDLPAAVKNQIARDARSIVKKHYKACRKAVLKNRKLAKAGKMVRVTAPNLPVIKKPCCYWNNQNFVISKDVFSATDSTVYISVPVMIHGKSERIRIPTKMTERQYHLFCNSKLGTLRIVTKNNQLAAQITYEAQEKTSTGTHIMGVDLGIKCPAVSYTDDGKVRFYGNGRKNKYMRRFYRYQRQKLGKLKKQKVIERIADKEQRIMKDIDHKISHDIVSEAVKRNVKTIKLEQLSNIRNTTRTSRKNNPSLHTWSFYRLAQYIEYKAKLSGIEVVYVNPAYTSQACPVCGHKHHAEDRHYVCNCGFKKHRDIVGAMNICTSTEICGNSKSA